MQSPPFVRIITFGPLELFGCEEPGARENASRYVPLSTERLNGRGATAAFTLLKVLLCQPHRHAPRDLLMELLWPEHTPRKAGAAGRCSLGPAYPAAPGQRGQSSGVQARQPGQR